MKGLNEYVLDNLDRYFSALEATGYLVRPGLSALLLLVLVRDIMNNMDEYLTEQDYECIRRLTAMILGKHPCVIEHEIVSSKDTPGEYPAMEGLETKIKESIPERIIIP